MDELGKLKQIADSQRREKAMVEGKIESLSEELSEEGWNSVGAAVKDMHLLEQKIDKMKKVFNTKLGQFKEKYAEELSQIT